VIRRPSLCWCACKTILFPIIEAIIDERLDTCRLDIDPRASVCVVMAAGGYPGKYKKGLEIKGIDAANRMRDVVVFHAGTRLDGKKILSHGGRVLGVTALGDTVELAIKKAYQAVAKINWTGVHYRTDIGKKALVRMQAVPRVGIVMGSDSDLKVMEGALGIFKKFGIPIEMTVASAHRSPDRAAAYAGSAKERGLKAIIAGAGHAAHLAGVLAAHTTLPVIGVPIDSSCLQGSMPCCPRCRCRREFPWRRCPSANRVPKTRPFWPCRSWRFPTIPGRPVGGL
jgi:phosphoribosylamine--glycine ligase